MNKGGINPYEQSLADEEGKTLELAETNTNFEQLEKNDLTVYPNPSSGYVIFTYNFDTEQAINIKLYDMVGKLVKQEKINSKSYRYKMELYDLNAGVYNFVFEVGGVAAKSGKLTLLK